MKRILVAAAMAMMSVSAFAQYNSCEAEMIDRRGRKLEVIRAYDCQEAMKQCRIRINDLRMRGVYDCRRIDNTGPIPGPQNPYTNPYPDTNPYPGPVGSDARRILNNGESAILNNRYVTVIGSSFQGLYAVRSTDGWNTITNGVRREALSVTNGCALSVCTSDSVIDIQSARYVKVVGISVDERLTTQSTDGWNTLVSGIERRNVAATTGCAYSRYGQMCVGNTVVNTMNRYMTVIGIQQDGFVVLKSTDGWNTISTRVDPASLVITN